MFQKGSEGGSACMYVDSALMLEGQCVYIIQGRNWRSGIV